MTRCTARRQPARKPAITSSQYAKDYNELVRVGGVSSTERPKDRADVARFYAASSTSLVFNLAARQISAALSLAEFSPLIGYGTWPVEALR